MCCSGYFWFCLTILSESDESAPARDPHVVYSLVSAILAIRPDVITYLGHCEHGMPFDDAVVPAEED